MNNTPLSQFVSRCVADRVPYRVAVDEFRRVWFEEALRRNGNNQCAAAEETGIHRNTLVRIVGELQAINLVVPMGKTSKHRRGQCKS